MADDDRAPGGRRLQVLRPLDVPFNVDETRCTRQARGHLSSDADRTRRNGARTAREVRRHNVRRRSRAMVASTIWYAAPVRAGSRSLSEGDYRTKRLARPP